jgi:predicted GNAT family N-acyltransferase
MKAIRVKTPEQLQGCFQVRTNVFVEEQHIPQDLEIDEKDESPAACHHMLIVDGDQPVAAARWYFYKDKTAKFQRIAVLKPYRGTGLGKRLLAEMEQQARELGAKEAILDAQCQVEGFYRGLGYEVISKEPFYDAGILHVRMQRSIH